MTLTLQQLARQAGYLLVTTGRRYALIDLEDHGDATVNLRRLKFASAQEVLDELP